MGDGAPQTATSLSPSNPRRRWRGWGRGVRVGAILAVGLGAGFLAWVLVDRNDEPEPIPAVRSAPRATAQGVARPSIASVGELRTAAASSRVPLYWAGAREGTKLELTRAPTGAVFVRYLPAGARPGDLQPSLTVATYPRQNGFAEVRTASRNGRSTTIPLAGGGLGVYDRTQPQNVHVAYPGQPYQIEVFAPEAGVATQLVSTGAIRPVD